MIAAMYVAAGQKSNETTTSILSWFVPLEEVYGFRGASVRQECILTVVSFDCTSDQLKKNSSRFLHSPLACANVQSTLDEW